MAMPKYVAKQILREWLGAEWFGAHHAAYFTRRQAKQGAGGLAGYEAERVRVQAWGEAILAELQERFPNLPALAISIDRMATERRRKWFWEIRFKLTWKGDS